jgi:DNA-binding winged helix-turn-helix (wHTH) protein/Tol biopolymer transport system component
VPDHTSPQREAQRSSAFVSSGDGESNSIRFYEFDRFRIDAKRRLLMRDGEPIPIKARALDTLLLFVQHAGRLLEKEELMTRLWPDTAVEEANLTQNVFEVRKALGEVPGEQRFIATVPRRGYRFVADVRTSRDDAPAQDAVAAGDQPPEAALVPPVGGGRRTIRYAGLAGAIALVLLGAGLYLASRRSAPAAGAPASAAPSLTRLTFGPGLQTDVSWSPDGRRIAYAWDKDGNFDLWIQNVDGGEPTRVTSAPTDDTQPAWSPDGKRLVFRSEADGGGIFTIGVDGGSVRRIAPFGRRPAWMPNGRDVVLMDNDAPHAAFVVSGDGGEAPRQLLAADLGRLNWQASAIHPEGRISVIAPGGPVMAAGFFVADRANTRLNAVDTTAAKALGLLEPGVIRDFTWSRSGTVLLVEALSDGVRSLWRVPVDPVSLRWRTPERLTTGPASAGGAAASPDGTRVAFTSAQTSTRAWLFPFEANAAQLKGEGRGLTDEDVSIEAFSLAADGTALCFTAREAGRNNLRLLHADLTTGRTTFLAEAFLGAPSRSGRKVAYLLTRTASAGGASPSTGREWALAVRDIDGREHLASPWGPGAMLAQDWALDDRAVLGSWLERGDSDRTELALWPIGSTMATGPERVLLAADGVNFWQARYSPDHRWVSFVAQRMRNPGTVEIGVVAPDSDRATAWTRVVEDHVWPDKPRWSPDGRTLYFLSQGRDGYFDVWGVRMDPARGTQSGTPFQITHLGSPRWHIDPDMQRAELGVATGKLVVPMQSVKGSLWLMSGVNP